MGEKGMETQPGHSGTGAIAGVLGDLPPIAPGLSSGHAPDPPIPGGGPSHAPEPPIPGGGRSAPDPGAPITQGLPPAHRAETPVFPSPQDAEAHFSPSGGADSLPGEQQGRGCTTTRSTILIRRHQGEGQQTEGSRVHPTTEPYVRCTGLPPGAAETPRLKPRDPGAAG